MLLGALLASIILVAPPAAHAVTPGSGGWYWPVGTENFHGWDGYWTYRPANKCWHLAQDMPSPVGHAVYAVGDGTVLESGGDHGYGGVIVMLHTTADGHLFKAVYGHIIPASGTGKGAKVKAGQVIGHVNSCRHVHFGIHPGRAYPPDNNPYRGHTYVESKTYGWVDPVKYLRANPRILKYAAPKIPTVATVETTAKATVLGVGDGSVYWTIGTGDEESVFCRTLKAGAVLPVDDDAVPSSLDTTRFPATIAATSFTLGDRLPLLTLAASTTTPAWKHATTMSGLLTNATGKPFSGATIVIEVTSDGTTWTRAATALTGLTGSFSAAVTPTKRSGVRARFAPPADYLPAFSVTTTVAPKPALTAPVLPKTVKRNASFSAYGTLTPRHTAGPGAVVLRVQRNVSGIWTDFKTATTTYRDCDAGTTYRGVLVVPAGSWRVRAQIPSDAAHAATASGWSTFTVR